MTWIHSCCWIIVTSNGALLHLFEQQGKVFSTISVGITGPNFSFTQAPVVQETTLTHGPRAGVNRVLVN